MQVPFSHVVAHMFLSGSEESPSDSGKTKELVRALFSPSMKLDTSCDSIKPLDSTCEDEPCDMSADHNLSKPVDVSNESCDLEADRRLVNKNLTDSNNEIHDNRTLGKVKTCSFSVLENNSAVNSVKDDTKTTTHDKIARSSKLKRIFRGQMSFQSLSEITNSYSVPESTSRASTETKLQTLSPLQNLVNADVRQNLSGSLNESSLLADFDTSDSVREVQKQKAVDTNIYTNQNDQHNTPKQPSLVIDGVCSPIVSSKDTSIITSPTFSQKNSKKRGRMYIDKSRKDNSSCSIDNALSDFFDPPSGAVGRRKKAPKKRKSIEIDTSLEFEVSDTDIKCSTPKETPVLHSILSSNKKEKRSNKKVRFSDNLHEPLTKKVTFSFENQVIETYSDKTKYNAGSDSYTNIVPQKAAQYTNDKENTEEGEIEIGEESCTDLEEKGLNCSRHSKLDLHASEQGRENDVETVKSNDDILNSKLEGTIFPCNKKVEINVSLKKYQDNVDDSSKSNGSKVDNIIEHETEEMDEFSQVSPSALKEMCHVAHNTSVDSISEKAASDTPVISNNKAANHKRGTVCVNSERLLVGKENMLVEHVGSSHMEQRKTSDDSLCANMTFTARKKFFYPSRRQIATSCPKKVFEYKNGGKNEGGSLVKSVSLNDLIQGPKQADTGVAIDLKSESKPVENHHNGISKNGQLEADNTANGKLNATGECI